jgi:hypothetical protein
MLQLLASTATQPDIMQCYWPTKSIRFELQQQAAVPARASALRQQPHACLDPAKPCGLLTTAIYANITPPAWHT